MPFLRQEPDNTLAETLGNLGSGLSNALNPMNQIRATDMLAQMRERQWTLQHEQTLDAANRNAAQNWMDTNPLGQDPATQAAFAAQLRNGQFPIEAATSANIAAGKYKQAQTASAAVENDPEMSLWPAADKLAAKSELLNNGDIGEIRRKHAEGTLTTAKTAAALGLQKSATAAVPEGADPETAAVVGSLALTDPAATETELNKQRALIGGANMPAGTRIDSPLVTIENQRNLMAGQAVTPPAQLVPSQTQADVTKEKLKGEVTPGPPSNVTRQVGSATTAIDAITGQPVPIGTPNAISLPSDRPDVQATADTQAAAEGTKAATQFAQQTLQTALGDGLGAKKMLTDVTEMRRLADIMNNDGPMSELQLHIANGLYKRFGMTLTGQESARTVFDNYRAALMATWRKDEGVQRLALPEIMLANLSLPDSQMSHDAIMEALDFVQAKANVGVQTAEAAMKAWNNGQPTPEGFTQFMNDRDKIAQQNPVEKVRKERIDKNTPNSETSPIRHQKMVNGKLVDWPPAQ